jgi:hypothetical protein
LIAILTFFEKKKNPDPEKDAELLLKIQRYFEGIAAIHSAFGLKVFVQGHFKGGNNDFQKHRRT